MNCKGCGVDVDPSQEQVNTAVDKVLETSLADAQRNRGVCLLCDHSQHVPWRHKTGLLRLFKISIVLVTAVERGLIAFYVSRTTERASAARQALLQMNGNAPLTALLGKPLTLQSVAGAVKQDETGWKEVRLDLQVGGPNGVATAYAVGGREKGTWVFSTLEVIAQQQRKKVDLISGRIIEYDPSAYVDSHYETPIPPEYMTTTIAQPTWDGLVPCVCATLDRTGIKAQVGTYSVPSSDNRPVDRFEADLRYGSFILRQTDLYLDDVFQVPLTRTYASNDWISQNKQHAFGWNTNHPYDIAPLGTRNPYTYQLLALEDSNFVYFDRISKGTSYADFVSQHSETSTRFYGATTKWNGNGWTTRLTDGSEIQFPESYQAKNLAQGAPTEISDGNGNRLELKRDGRRNLQQILTPHGHWIKFQYDDQSRITRADDDAGNWTKYAYDVSGTLADVVLSSGRERHYSYDKLSMTKIFDENGNLLLRNWYDARWSGRSSATREPMSTTTDMIRDNASRNL
jgi:YD repeat-containing protein